MKKNTGISSVSGDLVDQTAAAMQIMQHYCEVHPRSPVAVRRPRLFVRSGVWVALLGPSVGEGIVGIGNTVEAALQTFDARYLADLHPPEKIPRWRRRSSSKKSAADSPPLQV